MRQAPLSQNPFLDREYRGRVNRVLDYIETNLDRNFSVEELAKVAGFSTYHFHRLFSAIVGETLFQFIQRVRLERAAAWLLTNPRRSVTEIALDCGFSGPPAFSRAFRSTFGMAPSEWRRTHTGAENSKLGKTDSKACKDQSASAPYSEGTTTTQRRNSMKRNNTAIANQGVRFEEFPELTLAYVRHVGPYQGDAGLFEGLWNKLMSWAGPRGLGEGPDVKYLVIYHDAPEITDDAKLRLSCCISVPEATQVDGDIGKMTLPAGKYALARFELTPAAYGDTWQWTYGSWLPSSGSQPDDRPTFELYPEPDKIGPNGEMTVDIAVPVVPL